MDEIIIPEHAWGAMEDDFLTEEDVFTVVGDYDEMIERVDGRKTICRGTIHADDRLCAEAEGLFVAMNRDRFQGLLDERQARLASGGGGAP